MWGISESMVIMSSGYGLGGSIGLIIGILVGFAALIVVLSYLFKASKKSKQQTSGTSIDSQDTERGENVDDAQSSPPSNDPQAEPTRQPYNANPYDILPRYEPSELPEIPEVPPPSYHPPGKNNTTE